MELKNTVYARIVLRYFAGFLIGSGMLPDDLGRELSMDPQVIALIAEGINWTLVVLGMAIAAVTEYAYRLAKRFGWAT